MKRLVAAALVLSLATPALAQQTSAPPPPPDDAGDPPPPPAPASPQEVGYYQSCFGVPTPGTGRFGIGGEVVIPVSGSSGGPPSLPISSASGDDRAALLVAVLAVAALPVVLYTVDNPAPRLVLQRFQCPTFALDFVGGADSGRAAVSDGASGFVSTRLTFGIGHVATDFQYDGATRGVSAFSAHMLVRVTPREHVEGGLAIGYRRSFLDDRIQDGLEIGLPHRYALWREGLRTFALELRPMLLLGSSVEPSLEAAFLIPLAQVLHLRLGGRVYTFEGNLLWGLAGGLNITL